MRYDERISPSAKLLYGEITALCNDRGHCWASNGYFSDLYKVSKFTISHWIKDLIDCGYLTSEIKYKKGTKEIESRSLFIKTPIAENSNTPIADISNTYCENQQYPIAKISKENNTRVNNTDEYKVVSKDTTCSTDVQRVITAWNDLGLSEIKKINPNTNRHKQLKTRLSEYGIDDVLTAIEKIKQSPFLKGQNKNGWTVSFDWFVKPNNFVKVLEGNYIDSKKRTSFDLGEYEKMTNTNPSYAFDEV